MKPVQITFSVYAENDSQVRDLEIALYNFVNNQYKKGILVSADKLINMLDKFGDSFMISQILK